MKRFLSPLLLFTVTLVALSCHAATDVNIKWGHPTEQELTMTTYEPDSLADAVVLARQDLVRYSLAGNYFKVTRTVKKRVKVLTDDGKDAANGAIAYYYNKHALNECEQLSKLKATAWNMENGKVVKTSMSNATISHEDANERVRVTKWAVPQVRQGTVFEVEYVIDSDLVNRIDDWVAQDEYPVAYTEYDVVIPECYAFNIDETGFCHLDHRQRNVTVNLGGGRQMAGTEYTFVGRDLPALKDEDYVFGSDAYAHRVAFELRQFALPGQLIRNYTTTWENIDKLLTEHEDFGRRLGGTPLKDELIAAGIPQLADAGQRAQRCVELVRSRVKWNGRYNLLSRVSSKQVLHDGSGSNADINFLLINTLNEAGVRALPVVLRDRASGFLPIARPSVDALTTMVVAIDIDGTWHFYDSSATHGGIDLLPSVLLTDRARIIAGKKGGSWVNLNELANGRSAVHINARMDPDGTITGTIEERYSGMSAMSRRISYHNADDSAAYVNKWASMNSLTITEAEFSGMDDTGSVVTARMSFTKRADSFEDGVMVVPSVITVIDESPFKHGKRVLPVDLPYRKSTVLSCSLTMPEGYEPEELLPDNAMSMQSNPKIKFERRISVADGAINSLYRLNEGDDFIKPEAYDQLTFFFDNVAKASTEMILIKPAVTQ